MRFALRELDSPWRSVRDTAILVHDHHPPPLTSTSVAFIVSHTNLSGIQTARWRGFFYTAACDA